MKMNGGMKMETAPNFGAIETLVHQGETVISSEDSAMIKWAIEAIVKGRTATLYCKPTVFEAIRKWYWTPERAEIVGFKPISAEQAARVKSDFNIEIDGYANSLACPRCGHVYSTYEFIQQGIEEHGEEYVRATFSLKRVAILQINRVQDIICRDCRLHILHGAIPPVQDGGSYYYDYRCRGGNAYGCCNAALVAVAPNLAVSRHSP
jgi:hypothetical protein